MRLLKTAFLSTTLLMGATYGADSLGAEGSEVAVKAESEKFAECLDTLDREQAKYLFTLNTVAGKISHKPIKRTENGEFNDVLMALTMRVNALIRTNTTLETTLATARGELERLNAEKTRALAEVQAKFDRENDEVDRFLDDDEHAVPAQPVGRTVSGEELKALLKELEELRAENERLKAAQSQSVARPLNYDAQLDAAQSLAAIRARRTAASVGETQSEVSDRHSMGSGSTAQVIAVLNGNPIADVSELSPFKNESTGGSPAGDNPLRSLLGPHVPVLDDQAGSAHAASPTAAGANTPSQAASQPTTPRAKAAKGDNVATTPVVARPFARPATPAPEAGPTTAGDAATPDAEARPAADETAVDPNAAEIARLQGEIEVHKKLLTLPHSTGGHTERTRGDGEQPQTHSTAKQRTAATNAIDRLKAGLAVLNATN